MCIADLVVRHAAWIRNTARLYHSNPCDADDLASETIYKLLTNGDRYNPAMDFKPWAKTIMANTYRTQYNRRGKVLFSDYESDGPYPSGDRADQRTTVRRILSVIHECNRRSVNIESVLLYARGYSYEEIAAIQGIPLGTVKRRIWEGRQMLREALGHLVGKKTSRPNVSKR